MLFAVQCYSEAQDAYMRCFQLSASEKEQFHEMAKKSSDHGSLLTAQGHIVCCHFSNYLLLVSAEWLSKKS